MNPSDFTVGEVYKMNVGKRSHTKRPYYVEIIEVSDVFLNRYIITNVPGYHSLKIEMSGEIPNWDYHIPRMEYIGKVEIFGHLIENQKGLYTYAK